ncbi:MAG: tetratricopeptide repeat protein [Myxococcota bacterium]
MRRSCVAVFASFPALALAAGDGDFWARTADPGAAEFERAMEAGRALLEEASVGASPTTALALLEAEEAFRRAISASPKRHEGWLHLGATLADLPGREVEAVDALRRGRALGGDDVDTRGEAALPLGVLLSKLGRFEESLEEYERVLRARIDDQARSVALANSAEALMALGRLSEAIERYRRAADIAPPAAPDHDARRGAWWGLAVALDRDEQIAKAEEAARQGLQLDPQIAYLGHPDVFFVPPGDIHYYYALGHQAAGQTAQAALRWKQFLAELPDSPWAYRAKQRLAELAPVALPKAKAKPGGKR